MGYAHKETTAFVKGGMPVAVSGVYSYDETGADVSEIAVFWASTGKPVSAGFKASLSREDWDAIADAIAEA